jgi:HSP20 family protein
MQEKPAAMEPVRKAGPPAVRHDFPFFLGILRDEFDRMFERFFTGWPIFAAEEPGWKWDLKVMEKDDAVVVRAEAPGFAAGDFDVQVLDGRLLLHACHKTEAKKDEMEQWSRRECYESVALPPGVDREKVEARYQKGVLTITLPRTPEGKGRKVAVKEE